LRKAGLPDAASPFRLQLRRFTRNSLGDANFDS
jgi:hypothetical protein